jgi:hypothetical protein
MRYQRHGAAYRKRIQRVERKQQDLIAGYLASYVPSNVVPLIDWRKEWVPERKSHTHRRGWSVDGSTTYRELQERLKGTA